MKKWKDCLFLLMLAWVHQWLVLLQLLNYQNSWDNKRKPNQSEQQYTLSFDKECLRKKSMRIVSIWEKIDLIAIYSIIYNKIKIRNISGKGSFERLSLFTPIWNRRMNKVTLNLAFHSSSKRIIQKLNYLTCFSSAAPIETKNRKMKSKILINRVERILLRKWTTVSQRNTIIFLNEDVMIEIREKSRENEWLFEKHDSMKINT